MKPEKAKFFCEYCGNEVKRNTKICPHCGRFFANIRCPSCSFIGNEEDFKEGCPKCGYAIQELPISQAKNQSKKRQSLKHVKTTTGEESLPIWVYALVIFLFCSLAAFALLKFAW